MAEIGNEAKLILKLAEARAEKKIEFVLKEHGDSDYYLGYKDAKNWIFADMAQICINLEEGIG